jgi:hypothetical protein
MFGSRYNTATGRESEIVKSGYDIKQGLQELSKLKSEFNQALRLDPADCNEETLNRYANAEGQIRGFNVIAKRVSKQKLNAARAMNQTHQIMWQHAQGAAQLELQWQQTVARNLEQMSEKLLDMGTVQQSHAGFAEYVDTADRIITY